MGRIEMIVQSQTDNTQKYLNRFVLGTKFLITYPLLDQLSDDKTLETAQKIHNEISIANAGFKISIFRSDCRLSKAQIFGGYDNFLLSKYHSYDVAFWSAYNEDRHRSERIRCGAESPKSVALRMESVIANLAGTLLTDDNLAVWMITHPECIKAYLKWYLQRDDLGDGGFYIEDGILRKLE